MNIIIQRGRVWKMDELPEYSIALDGAVSGPKIDPEHRKFSFDHHSDCYRFCTLSACMQAHTAIRLGLDPEQYSIFVNDIDSDVAAAIWCLKNKDRCEEPLAIKLINAIGLGDMHAGAFNTNGMGKVIEWVSLPETDSRKNGDYSKLSDEGLNSILESVLLRIDMYVNGDAKPEVDKIQLSPHYNILRNQNGWVLVESDDPHAFSGLYKAGFDRIVLLRHQPDGSICYSIAKRSDFIGEFPITKFYTALNKIEPGWGGSSVIGGSPRNHDGSRSKIPPEKLTEIIDEIVLKKIKSQSIKAVKKNSTIPPGSK